VKIQEMQVFCVSDSGKIEELPLMEAVSKKYTQVFTTKDEADAASAVSKRAKAVSIGLKKLFPSLSDIQIHNLQKIAGNMVQRNIEKELKQGKRSSNQLESTNEENQKTAE
jgi:hypothetical protein